MAFIKRIKQYLTGRNEPERSSVAQNDLSIYDIRATLGIGAPARGPEPSVDGPKTTSEQRESFDARSNVANKRPAPAQPSERERRPSIYANDPAYLPAENRPEPQPATTKEQRRGFDARSNVTNKASAPQSPSERERRPTVYDGNDPEYLPNEYAARVNREQPTQVPAQKRVTFNDNPLEERKHEPLANAKPEKGILKTGAAQLLEERDTTGRPRSGNGSAHQDLSERSKRDIGSRQHHRQ